MRKDCDTTKSILPLVSKGRNNVTNIRTHESHARSPPLTRDPAQTTGPPSNICGLRTFYAAHRCKGYRLSHHLAMEVSTGQHWMTDTEKKVHCRPNHHRKFVPPCGSFGSARAYGSTRFYDPCLRLLQRTLQDSSQLWLCKQKTRHLLLSFFTHVLSPSVRWWQITTNWEK